MKKKCLTTKKYSEIEENSITVHSIEARHQQKKNSIICDCGVSYNTNHRVWNDIISGRRGV